MSPSPEQYSGSLIGQALGDALGFNVEGFGPEFGQKYVEGVMRAGHAARYGRKPFEFGQYTDDTQLARELSLSLLADPTFDAEDYARRIATLFADNSVVGRGRATEAAAQRLIKGVSWEESGTPPPAAGNGSAMRVAPVGLMYHGDIAKLIDTAYQQGRITHQDGRAAAGATIIAGAVALALQGGEINVTDFAGQLSEWAMAHSTLFAEGIVRLNAWVAMEPRQAAVQIAAFDQGDEEAGFPGISPFVIPSVLWSLYAFVRTPGDYWETIATAISAGGDTDTTAAMAGAISGAYNGLSGLPTRLAMLVNDRHNWGYTQLKQLGEKLHEVSASLM